MSKAKAIATVNKSAEAKKQSINLDAIQQKTSERARQQKQTADSKQTASKKQSDSKKQSAKKQTVSKSATADKKLSAYKNACRMYASLNESADADSIALVNELKSAIQHDDFNVVCKDTTACALFIVDDNKNTVCNVYDCLRIQFTTVQARKYRDALLTDSRFFTHLYKNNEFISCKCSTFDDFVSAMNFVYSVYVDSKKQSTTVTAEAEAEAK